MSVFVAINPASPPRGVVESAARRVETNNRNKFNNRGDDDDDDHGNTCTLLSQAQHSRDNARTQGQRNNTDNSNFQQRRQRHRQDL